MANCGIVLGPACVATAVWMDTLPPPPPPPPTTAPTLLVPAHGTCVSCGGDLRRHSMVGRRRAASISGPCCAAFGGATSLLTATAATEPPPQPTSSRLRFSCRSVLTHCQLKAIPLTTLSPSRFDAPSSSASCCLPVSASASASANASRRFSPCTSMAGPGSALAALRESLRRARRLNTGLKPCPGAAGIGGRRRASAGMLFTTFPYR